ncbi:hypothetical protein WA1_47235 [Scytonema hofmannii PCC 7110]|uniref:Uncharacterized protein n=1 Tax=Scytonema hofmannii PCC 7110 TaxID=128403 RepID=A0A139WXQ1_9CYAN|nr:hypothetical protein [Scytonema hofmannii]KYC37224.1 hypothetical protein WA1_47235 [Scytonema hofmannii PCC 7110]
MTQLVLSQQKNSHDRQPLCLKKPLVYLETSISEELSKTEFDKLSNDYSLKAEFDIEHISKKESERQASSENSILPALHLARVSESGIAVSQQRISGFRRWSALSEY